MVTDYLRTVISLIKILILTAVVVAAYIRMRRDGGSAPAPLILFILGTACHLCTEAYYLAHLLLASWDRMPYFSVEDIGIFGSFLLYSSSLKTAIPHLGKYAPKYLLFSIAFTLVNAGLYVYYGTELIPALFYFLIMSEFMLVILTNLDDIGALSGRSFAVFVSGGTLMAALILTDPFMDGAAKTAMLYVESCLWFAALAYLIIVTVAALKRKDRSALPLSFAAFLCSIFTMYMTYDPSYSMADILSGSINILMCLAVLQEVRKA